MRSVPRTVRLASGLALLAALSLAGAAAAEGEGPRAWVFDVRVVRVVGPAALGEEGPAWAAPEGGVPVLRTAWKDLLASLKDRGATTVLLDRRVTAVAGVPASVSDTQVQGTQVFERRDLSNETWRAGTVETGVKAEVLAADHLSYKVEARWELRGSDPAAPGLQAHAHWSGTWPRLEGETLVLTHRQQLPRPGGEAGAVAGVEIYAFLTARPVP